MAGHFPLIYFFLQFHHKRLILCVQIRYQKLVLLLKRGILIQMHCGRIAGVIIVHPFAEMVGNINSSRIVSSILKIYDDEFISAVNFQNVTILQLDT